MCGWDKIREQRHSKLIQQQLIDPTWKCSPRDEHSPPWQETANKEWEDARMATYAAQITIMDRGIGRILEKLRGTGMYDNTVIFFLSDNGGCAEVRDGHIQLQCHRFQKTHLNSVYIRAPCS